MAYLDNVYAVVQIAPTGIPTYVRLSQNENGRVLNFAVSGDSLPAGSTVALTGTKPDGAVYSASGTLADNVATFNEDEQLTAVAGEWDAKVEVTNSGNLIATGRIKFVIDADPSGGNIPSDSQLDGYIAEMLSLLDAGKAESYGSPLVASTVAGMIDQSRVYVYTGSETGYTAGNWYYWNGSAWTSGGVYNAVAVSTDTTLSIAGKAADAKATGDSIDELKDDLSYINDKTDYIATGSGEVKEHLTFHLGYVHGLPNYTPQNPGQTIYNDTICTTDYISVSESEKIYFDSSEYKICVVYYDSDKTYQTFSSFSATSPAILNTNYAYCVPELRKLDESAFTDSDIIDADETAYYVPSITVDIVRHAELEPFVDSTKQKIQPDFIPNLPINVYRTISGYSYEVPEFTIDTSWVTVFVDSVYGNDSNNGTEDHPVKTITQADYLCRVAMNNGKKAVMQIADDSVFYIDDIPASYDAKKSYIIRAEHKATIFAGKKPTFTVDGSHYVSEALTSYNIIGCVNTSETDDYGLFKPMVPVESVNDVDETANSYYIDSTNKIVYVNPSTQISDIVVIFSNKYAMNPATYGFTESSFCMIENITFVGNSTATGRESSTVGETIKRTIYVKNCIFQHGFSNNCVSFNDFDYTYIVDCIAGYAKYDCFNYHFTRKPTPTDALVVEVNTCGKEGGYYSGISGTSDQISTCHDGANILRCNTHGYNSDGSLIADVNGCYSVNIDCTVLNTGYADALGRAYAPFRFDNANAQRNGIVILQNCYGYDSRNSNFVSAVDLILNGINGIGTIEATNLSVGKKMI